MFSQFYVYYLMFAISISIKYGSQPGAVNYLALILSKNHLNRLYQSEIREVFFSGNFGLKTTPPVVVGR